jgi:pimeloyl-ACP methyl ester carboxylesterase
MKLYSTTIGDGPKRAALVHGMTGSGPTWFDFAPWVADLGYTVTLVDLRGHGRSERGPGYSPDDLGDDLVDTLPPELDVIAGHSLGGRALLSAVERLRPRSAIYLDPGWVVPRDLVVTRPVRADGSIMSVDEADSWFPEAFMLSREQRAVILESQAHFDATMLADPWWPLPDLAPPEHPAVPSLIVLADPPVLVPPDLVSRLEAGGYVVRVVPGAGHDLHITDLEPLKLVIRDWL